MVDKKEENALELWKRWFEFSGDPWESIDVFEDCCFFCCGDRPDHELDCVYVAAKKLIGYVEIEDA